MKKVGIMQGRLLPKDINKYQVFPSNTWKKEFELSKETGFSAIELLFDVDAYYNNPLIHKSGQEEIVKLSCQTDIAVSSICADFFKKYGFFQRSQQAKDGNIFILKKLIEACNLIKCNIILIPFVEDACICSRNDKDDIIGVIKSVADLLERYGVNLCFETTLQWTELLELIEEISHPNIRIYYDIGNSAYFKYDPADEIRNLSKWISGVHIKDRDEKGNNVLLGTGLVDFSACFKSLKEIMYEGSYILETTMGNNPIETAKTNLKFINSFV